MFWTIGRTTVTAGTGRHDQRRAQSYRGLPNDSTKSNFFSIRLNVRVLDAHSPPPVGSNFTKENPVQIYSVWSERHMAFAAGLGTFSLHEGFISQVGCNIRVTSVLTDAPLSVTARKSDDPYANCLFYTTGKCKKCAARCPADAISEQGHDKVKCYLQLKEIEGQMTGRVKSILKPHLRVIEGRRETSYPVGCAFCQFDVPCMERNPLKQKF
jgi:epoxyqueuosine reductase QueG